MRVLGHAFTGVVQDSFDGVCEVAVEGGHFVLFDGMLELFQGLAHRLGRRWVGEVEDIPGESEVGVLDVLRIRPHGGVLESGQ